MGAALKFRHADVPRQADERARLKVIYGPDAGATFVVNGISATIGRGEDCDVVITDLKASRRHAVLSLAVNGWSVQDLGSANGISHNGKATRGAAVKTGDTLTVGETTLEFLSSEAGTSILRAVPRSKDQIDAERDALDAQRARVRQLANIGGPKAGPVTYGTPPSKNSRGVLVLAMAVIIGFVLIDTNPKPIPKKRIQRDTNLAQYLPATEDKAVNKSAEMFMKSGFREYREKNYLRARTQFETVLQIDPANQLAQQYVQNCNQAIDDLVKFELDRGRKAYESGSLKQSKIHYETVLRLLYRDQSNPAFIEARDQLTKVVKEMAEE